jgi:hypothetical protein
LTELADTTACVGGAVVAVVTELATVVVGAGALAAGFALEPPQPAAASASTPTPTVNVSFEWPIREFMLAPPGDT